MADRIAVMRDGRLLQIDRPSALFRAPADDYVARLVQSPRRQRALLDALDEAP